MTHAYYKEASGALVVYDINRPVTFDAVQKWKTDIDSKLTLSPDDRPIPAVLLANKVDVANESSKKPPDVMEKYCQEQGYINWFETSAKENINIDKATQFLITKMIENEMNGAQDRHDVDDRLDLNQPKKMDEVKGGCC
eukprot:TRINITY_DN1453_c0_g1_i1.p1 TRINITY_DN1453_c0_g1~~TRINITY_DN1453_c0_g1_i1.p1  ORF type:complete len:139 (+),score=22.51 TRINITY_DN1453_c0_g1_i1:190-606(+)